MLMILPCLYDGVRFYRHNWTLFTHSKSPAEWEHIYNVYSISQAKKQHYNNVYLILPDKKNRWNRPSARTRSSTASCTTSCRRCSSRARSSWSPTCRRSSRPRRSSTQKRQRLVFWIDCGRARKVNLCDLTVLRKGTEDENKMEHIHWCQTHTMQKLAPYF